MENLPALEIGDLPAFQVENLPAFEIENLPAFEIENLPAFEIENPPSFELNDTPAFAMENRLSFEMNGPPAFDMENPVSFEELRRAWLKVLDERAPKSNRRYSPAEQIYILDTHCIRKISQARVAKILGRPLSGLTTKVQTLRSDHELSTTVQIEDYITQEKGKLNAAECRKLQKLMELTVSLKLDFQETSD
jgi:hypothetical protein